MRGDTCKLHVFSFLFVVRTAVDVVLWLKITTPALRYFQHFLLEDFVLRFFILYIVTSATVVGCTFDRIGRSTGEMCFHIALDFIAVALLR
jgi:hypothetical protein